MTATAKMGISAGFGTKPLGKSASRTDGCQSDVSDDGWALVKPVLPAACKRVRPARRNCTWSSLDAGEGRHSRGAVDPVDHLIPDRNQVHQAVPER